MLSGMVGFPGGSVVKNLLQCMRPGLNPWVGKIPWRRAWQPTPVFLPGESHGQRSLAGCSPRGRTESDTTEVTRQLQQSGLEGEGPFSVCTPG